MQIHDSCVIPLKEETLTILLTIWNVNKKLFLVDIHCEFYYNGAKVIMSQDQ